MFIEEEWNPDGKGRHSNDTGESQLLMKFHSRMHSATSFYASLSLDLTASVVNPIYLEIDLVTSSTAVIFIFPSSKNNTSRSEFAPFVALEKYRKSALRSSFVTRYILFASNRREREMGFRG